MISLDRVYWDGFATGFVAGMAFMAVGVVCFVSTVRHLIRPTNQASPVEASSDSPFAQAHQ
jgi:hypothetical protein